MLVLERKVGQSVDLGDQARLTVLRIIRGKVKFLLQAPRWMKVLRDELESTDQTPSVESGDEVPESQAKAAQLDPNTITNLVLSRKLGEAIVVDGVITVKLNKVKGVRVSLGLDAPADVQFIRSELERAA